MESMTAPYQLENRKVVSSIGMIVLLVSFGMLFATLLLGYLIFRLTSDVWPPMGIEPISLLYPTISTGVIALSSWSFIRFQKNYEAKQVRAQKNNYFFTLFFGAVFMLTQFALWNSMANKGLYVSGGVFQSLFYSLTWIHAAHIVAGIFSLLILLPTVFGEYEAKKEIWIDNVGKFWHFLGIIWFLMYLIMFVY